MRSMTGFGRGTAAAEGWELAVHVNSVNRKSLDIAVSLPREWQVLEPDIAAIVRESVTRGRVHVALDVRGPATAGLNWDEATVDGGLARLEALAARRGVPFVLTADLLWQVVQASRSERVSLDPEKALALVRAALEPALRELVATREREGAALGRDLAERVASLQARLASVAARAGGTLANYRENLLARLRQAGLDLDLNDERVLKEIALFADRIDIAEELTRARSHLEHLAQLLQASEPAGRKAEFLLQEIGREVHTIGSKANDLEIARVVIECKNEIERVREQIQNLE